MMSLANTTSRWALYTKAQAQFESTEKVAGKLRSLRSRSLIRSQQVQTVDWSLACQAEEAEKGRKGDSENGESLQRPPYKHGCV